VIVILAAAAEMSSSRFAALNAVGRRSMAAHAAAKPSLPAAEGVKVSTAENGVLLVSAESPVPGLCTLGIMGKLGPRFESYDNAGSSQMVRLSAGLANKEFSFFGMTKNIQQAGTALEVDGDREHTFFYANVLAQNVSEMQDYLMGMSSPHFYPWELGDISVPRMKDINAGLSQCTLAAELLHRAAYRDSGLGMSQYAPNRMIGQHNHFMLRDFFSSTMASSRAALVGVGIDTMHLTRMASVLQLSSEKGAADAKAQYFGGEQRMDLGGGSTSVILAAEVTPKEALAAELLLTAMGNGPSITYSNKTGGGGKIQAAVGELGVAQKCSFSYSDSCLVGASVRASGKDAGKAVQALAKVLRSAAVTEQELTGAKKALIMSTEQRASNPASLGSFIGAAALSGGSVAISQTAAINSVTMGDVQAVAKKLASGKLSMSAVGNLSTVPYLDTL